MAIKQLRDLNYTPSLRQEDAIEKWLHINGEGLTCGRLASEVADLLKGKNSPQYTPHVLSGTRIIITNISKIIFSGKKLQQKKIYRHTQRFGGLKETLLKYEMEKDPETVLFNAIKCMLPTTRQRRNLLKQRLFLYAGNEHHQGAQQPVTMTLQYSK